MSEQEPVHTPRGLIRDNRGQNDYGAAYAVMLIIAFSLSTAAMLFFADWGRSFGYSVPQGPLLTGIAVACGIGVTIAVATHTPSPNQRGKNGAE